jgi:hypothetical protein
MGSTTGRTPRRSNSIAQQLVVVLGILGVVLTLSAAALQAASPTPEAIGKAYMQGFGEGDFRSLYRTQVGTRVREELSEAAFVEQNAALRSQVGGSGEQRVLVDAGSMSTMNTPSGPVSGTFYFVRLKARYPAGMAYEDIYLEREDGHWKVVGIWLLPAPGS